MPDFWDGKLKQIILPCRPKPRSRLLLEAHCIAPAAVHVVHTHTHTHTHPQLTAVTSSVWEAGDHRKKLMASTTNWNSRTCVCNFAMGISFWAVVLICSKKDVRTKKSAAFSSYYRPLRTYEYKVCDVLYVARWYDDNRYCTRRYHVCTQI